MNLILSISICFILCTSHLNGQSSICTYEQNLDYWNGTDLTYIYAKSAALCCNLCGYQAGCIGIYIYINIWVKIKDISEIYQSQNLFLIRLYLRDFYKSLWKKNFSILFSLSNLLHLFIYSLLFKDMFLEIICVRYLTWSICLWK
jgi:hypothetical protein